jgi:hypothetical protein
MRVKIHPHRNKVMQGIEECISVTPDKQGGRAYYAGTVVLRDVRFRIHQSGVDLARMVGVRNVHAWAVGELIDQNACQHPLTRRLGMKFTKVTYHFVIGRFLVIDSERAGMVCYGRDVTDEEISLLYAVGRDFYILEGK